MYIQEKTAPGRWGRNLYGTRVLVFILEMLYRMQEESPSGKGPVVGLCDQSNDF